MIHIDPHPGFTEIGLLERAARLALEHRAGYPALQSAEDADLTIVLTDDEKLHSLNRDYLGIDAPTDVLSFPASESDPETGVHYLGDILISIQRAAEQARAAGHSTPEELQLLVVHGVLHLLGHDHAAAEDKFKMWKAQSEILQRLGLEKIKVQEE